MIDGWIAADYLVEDHAWQSYEDLASSAASRLGDVFSHTHEQGLLLFRKNEAEVLGTE